MNVKITRDWTKSFFVMIVAVIIMGMCVSLLVMCDMGTDHEVLPRKVQHRL